MKVFISYSRADAKETANAIHEYLTKYGHHDVFIDTSDIPYGGDWNEVIQKEISICDIFVIIITPSALYRSEVEKEVELAKKLKKKIIPCIAKDYVEEDEIKWELNRYQGFFYDRDSKLAMDLHMMIKRESKTQRNTSNEVKIEIKKYDDKSIEKLSLEIGYLKQEIDKLKNQGTKENKQIKELKHYHDNKIQELASHMSETHLDKVAIGGAKILWVDDNPINNEGIIDVYQNQGVDFHLATSTSQALRYLSKNKYNLIISDMGRESIKNEGINMIKKIKTIIQSPPPIYIFCSRFGAESYGKEAMKEGASLVTSSISELITNITKIVGHA